VPVALCGATSTTGLADGGLPHHQHALAILYNFFLDRFIAGFTVGAIK
jgi:hypothetical protein